MSLFYCWILFNSDPDGIAIISTFCPEKRQTRRTGGQGWKGAFSHFLNLITPTDRPTDRLTGRSTDRWTDKACYRVASPRLKKKKHNNYYSVSWTADSAGDWCLAKQRFFRRVHATLQSAPSVGRSVVPSVGNT